MRILTIMQRVLRELFRDKRTLALMFIAPIFVLWLMSIIFTASSTTRVMIAMVHVPKQMQVNLDNVKHVDIKTYPTNAQARKALKNDRVDAIVDRTGNKYRLTHANIDSSKTAAVKMAVKTALVTTNIKDMARQLDVARSTLTKVQDMLPETARDQMVSNAKGLQKATPDISNYYVYGNSDTGFFDKMLPILMGFFVFFFVFLISGMALLKERTSGTLDRLLATPVRRSDIIFGYMASYGILAVIQTIVIVLATIWILKAEVVGSILSIIIVNLILALVALSFGIFLSTFACSEFQMMQFIPLVVLPQIFFSGIIPLNSMAEWIQAISNVIPIKYAGDAISAIMLQGKSIMTLGLDIGVLALFLVVLTTLNINGLKRYRKI